MKDQQISDRWAKWGISIQFGITEIRYIVLDFKKKFKMVGTIGI